MRKYCFILIMLCVGISFSLPALCQKNKAKVLFDEGVAALEESNYSVALAAFQEAYSLSPHWAVLAHIGNCHAQMDQPIQAIESLNKYLEEGGTKISPTERETATQLIVEQKKKVAVLLLKVERDGVEAKVDGESIGTSPFKETMLLPGNHQISVRFEENDVVTRSVDLEGGEELVLRIEEEQHAAAPPPPAEAKPAEEKAEEAGPSPFGAPTEEEEEEEEEDESGEGSLVPFYISVGVAAAGLVVGGVGFGLYIHFNASENNYRDELIRLQTEEEAFQNFTWEETCVSSTVPDQAAEYFCNTELNRRDFENRKGRWLVVGIVGAGVFGLALVPTILFAVNRHWFAKDGEETAAFSVTPLIGPDHKGLMLNVAF